MVDGGVECGPNAVLAFAREGYTKLKINPNELIESLSYPGFIKLASQSIGKPDWAKYGGPTAKKPS